MKRSEINNAIQEAKEALNNVGFTLPRFAYWSKEEWGKHDISRIKTVMQGWDITDFGMGNFSKIGAVLFTVRNGTTSGQGTPYAEKIIFLKDGQRLPCHYHATKTEDIINRGGGRLWIVLYLAKEDGSVDSESPVSYFSDGIRYEVPAGERVYIERGDSITLEPYVYHIFGAEGDLVCGEVSSINDDLTDNYFSEDVRRFADIEEDEEAIHLLCNEY